MKFNFVSKKPFSRKDEMQPDNYYLNECLQLFDSIYGKETEELWATGNSGQCGGFCSSVIEYEENERKIELLFYVQHEDLNINIDVHFADKSIKEETSTFYLEFIKQLERKIKEWRDPLEDYSDDEVEEVEVEDDLKPGLFEYSCMMNGNDGGGDY